MKNHLCIGKIGKPIGLKGEAKFHLFTDFIEQIQKGLSLIDESNKSYTIEHFNAKKPSVKFEQISSIDAIKPLVNTPLYQSIEDTRQKCRLDKDEFFWFDIIGCSIIENGILLGKIQDIDRLGSVDFLLIETDKSLTDKKLPKSFLIPYQERYIKSVDMDKKEITTNHAFDILENS